MNPTQRLAKLGVSLPAVAAPVGGYVPALSYGTTVRTSGQLPLEAGVLRALGRVGDGPDCVSPEEAAACARVAALNALAALAEAASGLDAIVRIVRVVGYVASEPSFTGQAAVLNGTSELMIDVFGDAGRHVRSVIGVTSLPLDAPVEIEVEALTG